MDHWKHVLLTHWGIDAQLRQLDGEYDLNFLAETDTGGGYVLKAMRPGCEDWLVNLQIEAMDHIQDKAPSALIPRIIPTPDGARVLHLADETGAQRLIWLIERLPGRCYAKVAPKTEALIHQIGAALGQTAKALQDFQHDALDREFKWNLMQAGWIGDELSCITNPDHRALIKTIHAGFDAIKPKLDGLPQQAIHNDANDYNILVDGRLLNRSLSGLIDFGDMCAAPRICDVAVAAAYLVLDHPNPEAALAAFVSGYHAAYPLTAAEVDLIWPLLRMRLAVSVVNSTLMAADNPDDPYVTISQAPAWRFLETHDLHPGLLSARLRAACGFPVVDGADRVIAWLDQERGNFAPVMGKDLSDAPLGSLSVEHSTWPQNPFHMPLSEAARVGEEFEDNGRIWLGYYHEPRLIYAEPAFRKGPWKASDRRTVHLAVDAFAPAGTPLLAPYDGTVFVAETAPDIWTMAGSSSCPTKRPRATPSIRSTAI